MKINYIYCILKFGVFLLIFSILPLFQALPTFVLLVLTYPYIVAKICGVIIMPSMDMACFYGDDTSRVNFMSATTSDGFCYEKFQSKMKELTKQLPKCKYSIVEIFGDYYYKELPLEMVVEKSFKKLPANTIKNEDDLNNYISQRINTVIPFDQPQWEFQLQEGYMNEKQSLIIWKSHHSFCDGVSVMSFHLLMGDDYDVSKLIAIKKIPLLQRLLVRLMFPLYIPKIMLGSMLTKVDDNLLHKKNPVMTGKKRVASSSDILFKDIKNTAKKLKITINDLMTACLSSTIKQYFEKKGDQQTSHINIVIPANIRFQHYEKQYDVKLENKFAPIPLTIPVISDISQALKEIPKITSTIRSRFGEIYATYALSFYFSIFSPYFLCEWFIKKSTLPITLAFSNTPGLLQPIYQGKSKSIKMQCYVVSACTCGLTISCMSYVDYFKITCVVDEAVMKEPKELIMLLENNIQQCFQLSNKMQIDSSKPDGSTSESEIRTPQQYFTK